MNQWDAADCPPFIKRGWVFFGMYTNVLCAMMSIYASYIVIYRGEEILDLVLNSVALFFVIEVDDFMLNKMDYRRVKDWYALHFDMKKYPMECGQMQKMGKMAATVLTPTALVFGIFGLFG